jgi:hypothetical protein
MKRHSARNHQQLNCDLYWIPVSVPAANGPCKVLPPLFARGASSSCIAGGPAALIRVQLFVDEYSSAVIAIHIDRIRKQSFSSPRHLLRQLRWREALPRKILLYPTDNGMWPSPRHVPRRIGERIQSGATHEKTHRPSPVIGPQRGNRAEPRSKPEVYADDHR